MLETNGIVLRAAQREIIDYMRDVYQIEDIKVRPGGKHLHVEYVYEGRRRKDTLPRGTGGDPNWVEVRKHDLRRSLGDPPPAPTTTTKRSLDEMIKEVQAKADLRGGTALGAVVLNPALPVITPQPLAGGGKTTGPAVEVKQKRFPCSVGTRKGSSDLTFYLSREIIEAMDRQYGKQRHYVVSYTYPGLWTAKPSRNAGRLIEYDAHRLRCGGGEAIRRLGRFSAVKTEALLRHNRVEFSVVNAMELLEQAKASAEAEPTPGDPSAPVQGPIPANPAAPAVEPDVAVVADMQAAREAQRRASEAQKRADAGTPMPVPPEPPPPVDPPPPQEGPSDPRERLRHVLRLIKAVEDEGTYQLINANGWRWRAADIGLED